MKIPQKILIFCLAGLLALLPAAPALAAPTRLNSSINSVTRLDLSSNKITGEKAEYTLQVNRYWRAYCSAFREKLDYTSRVLEQINLQYDPQNRLARPVPLMSLQVFDKRDWNSPKGYDKLLETSRYVFAIQVAPKNPFDDTNKLDKSLFALCLTTVKDYSTLADMITLGEGDEKVYENAIWVNGSLMKNPVVALKDVLYLPLRECAQTLGYTVAWLPAEAKARIAKGGAEFFLSLDEIDPKMKAVMQNGLLYVSYLFFIQQLKTSLEVNPYNCVYIYSNP